MEVLQSDDKLRKEILADAAKKADRIINNDFYGTLPYFIEIDTGKELNILVDKTGMSLILNEG